MAEVMTCKEEEEYLQTIQAINDLESSIIRLCRGESDESSSKDIVARVEDFLSRIPRNNLEKSMEHIQIFKSSGVAKGLVSLYISHIKGLRGDCLSNLVYLLETNCFPNRTRYFDNAKAVSLIEELFPLVDELSCKLLQGLDLIMKSSLCRLYRVSASFRTSFDCDIIDFAFFSLHLRKAIEDHMRSEGQLFPVRLNDNIDKPPCYLDEIGKFHAIFFSLQVKVNQCLRNMEKDILDSNGEWEFNPGWSHYLSVLEELNKISKLYQGSVEEFSSILRSNQFTFNVLIRYSKRGFDHHKWLCEHKDVTDFESRRHLVMMMLPKVNDDSEGLHKMLIDRLQLLTESFEYIASAKPKCLCNDRFVEFKSEVAIGSGVLREWFFLVCQALFNPQNALFLACPYDRQRFFPNPASKLNPLNLKYFGFCGRMIALAIMHEVQVGITFDRVFFLQLAGELISLEDVSYADPCLYVSCKKILEMDVDFMDSDALGLTFVREVEEFGSRKLVELCPGGSTIVVNSKNREEYVELLIQHCFVKSISEQVAYFSRGFGEILCRPRLQKIFFQTLELKDLDCMLLGSDRAICVEDWKAHTDYDGYKESDDQICWFWKVVEGMSSEQRRVLLFFWISVKYLPVNGFSGLPSRLCICKSSRSRYRLPSSSTCFYSLYLPPYPSLAIMQQRLILISQEHLGCSYGNL
ncbi:HECT [Macleaya cordata]|uniref:HECT-type E3 ubiquitin transferase n=1 Tax=Macleaya cordata TaxID=56857 RepID=A0A200Q7Z7_MACCD|nr:HECT [Macleaya cordata]